MKPPQPLTGLSLDPEPPSDPSERILQHDNSQLLAMSASGPPEDSRVKPFRGTSTVVGDDGGQRRRTSIVTMPDSDDAAGPPRPPQLLDMATQTGSDQGPPVELRTHFTEFAAQLRLHRHNEHTRRMLEHRRQYLQKAVALSGRLQRLSSWVHDGLVEISRNEDSSNTSSFVRVQQHLQDLSDVCVSQWNYEIQALDPVNQSHDPDTRVTNDSFLDKLSPESQRECLDFIRAIRSNPRYLIDRFKAVSPHQLSALSTSPRYQNLHPSILASISQNSGRSSQRRHRIQSYSKSLELYATSFERRNAITFLLYNCFGSDQAENSLRISTWASICAGLFEESRPAFTAIIYQVLSGFVSLGRWPARERFHLFLMDVLQRGAFVIQPFDPNHSTGALQSSYSDHAETDQTREFFDAAVTQLFHILYWEGGIPDKALELAQAIEAKLEDPQLQNEFRAFFIFEWFIRYFLRITMNFPENERMLLQFHISHAARRRILVQLHQRADAAASQVYLPDPEQPVHERVRYCVQGLVGLISAEHVQNPYPKTCADLHESTSSTDSATSSALTICVEDMISVLDALSQQYNDPVLSSSLSAFASQYPTANNGFRRLRNELLILQNSSLASLHPCQENWLVLPVQRDGRPGPPRQIHASGRIVSLVSEKLSSEAGPLDVAQKAAIRLVLDEPVADGATLMGMAQNEVRPHSLTDLFREKARDALNDANNLDAFYWNTALEFLESRYPSAAWRQDDTRILGPLIQASRRAKSNSFDPVYAQIAKLEDAYGSCKRSLQAASKRLHQLKVRLWYETAVITSGPYEEARNIARALIYMALPAGSSSDAATSTSSERTRPGTSTSTASSMFEQTRVDTVNILKAPKEHGGARKLADEQVEMTKKWLTRNGVENFCKGEERIHRFCMEIRVTTRKLVAETFAESPVLWSSELWAKEKLTYEVGVSGAFSVHGSTRPPSVMSETLSASHYLARPPLGPLTFSSRSLDVDATSSQGRKSSFYSLGSHRLNRDILGSDIGVSLSPGPSLTATSGESVTSMWSPLPSRGSATTASLSLPSRAPSISNEVAVLRLGDSSVQKAKFLDDLAQDLTTLLLSDLGNPVWCQGSETDNWIGNARQNQNITIRLERQQQISRLVPVSSSDPKTRLGTETTRPAGKRRTWSADSMQTSRTVDKPQPLVAADFPRLPNEVMMEELQDVLERISNHIDPRLKLDTVHEFKILAMRAYPTDNGHDPVPIPSQTSSSKSGSRKRGSSVGAKKKGPVPVASIEPREPRTEEEITEYLKKLLLKLRHRTLFRDLQYIAAFISADTLNKTDTGRAFLQVALGSLACKAEYCRTMVDLADTIVTKDSIKRRISDSSGREEGILKAKDYWILAAREGNAIAQRELASLYLAHPEVPPVVSLPLSLSSEIFKNEMMWHDEEGLEGNTQSLCLALHWMQQAGENGDELAKRKLRERRDGTSIR